MDWIVVADAFVALMQALSLGFLCAGAAISIREGLDQSRIRGGIQGQCSVDGEAKPTGRDETDEASLVRRVQPAGCSRPSG